MPYKSDAQRKYFHAAEERGEISKSTVDEFDKASKGKDLPEKVSVSKAHKIKKLADHAKKMWRGGGMDGDGC